MPRASPGAASSGRLSPVRVSCRTILRAIGGRLDVHYGRSRSVLPLRKDRKRALSSYKRARSRRRGKGYGAGTMPAASAPTRRLAEVEAAFRSMPERFLGASPGFDATYHLRVGDIGHAWEVRVTTHGVRVRKGASRRDAD